MTKTSSWCCCSWPSFLLVLTGFLVNLIVYSITMGIGVWNRVFLRVFNQTVTKTSLVGSLLNTTMFLSGFASSVFLHYCRPSLSLSSVKSNLFASLMWSKPSRTMVVLGGLVAGLGHLLTSLSNDLYSIYLTYSCLVGIGFGLAYTPVIVVITQHFKEKATLPLGLAASGIGIGTFIYPPINEFILSHLSWRPTMQINGLFCLGIIACGIVLELSYISKPVVTASTDIYDTPQATASPSIPNPVLDFPSSTSAAPLLPFCSPPSSPLSLSSPHVSPSLSKPPPNSQIIKYPSTSLVDYKPVQSPPQFIPHESTLKSQETPCATHQKMSGPSAANGGAKLPSSPTSSKSASSLFLFPSSDDLPKISLPTLHTDSPSSHNYCYFLLCLNNFLILFGILIVMDHVIGHATKADLLSEENAHLMVSMIGVSNLLGRVFLGWLCQSEKVSTTGVYALCCLSSGLAAVFAGLCQGHEMFPYFSALLAIFGFCSGCIGPLLPPIVYTFLDEDNLDVGFGGLLLFEGVGCLCGPPMAGHLVDKFRSYKYSFFLAGLAMVLSGLLMVPPVFWLLGRNRKLGKGQGSRSHASKAEDHPRPLQHQMSNVTTTTEI